jgi:F-type H+-transporting ATPase subunit epsilon
MTGAMHLTISTPASVLADADDVRSLRAEDDSGGFGIWPGHTDLLTVLGASVVRWRKADGAERFCALRGAVLTVTGGQEIAIACREGVIGDDLEKLEQDVFAQRAAEKDAEARARVEHVRLHAHVIRQLMRVLPAGRIPTFNCRTCGTARDDAAGSQRAGPHSRNCPAHCKAYAGRKNRS